MKRVSVPPASEAARGGEDDEEAQHRVPARGRRAQRRRHVMGVQRRYATDRAGLPSRRLNVGVGGGHRPPPAVVRSRPSSRRPPTSAIRCRIATPRQRASCNVNPASVSSRDSRPGSFIVQRPSTPRRPQLLSHDQMRNSRPPVPGSCGNLLVTAARPSRRHRNDVRSAVPVAPGRRRRR